MITVLCMAKNKNCYLTTRNETLNLQERPIANLLLSELELTRESDNTMGKRDNQEPIDRSQDASSMTTINILDETCIVCETPNQNSKSSLVKCGITQKQLSEFLLAKNPKDQLTEGSSRMTDGSIIAIVLGSTFFASLMVLFVCYFIYYFKKVETERANGESDIERQYDSRHEKLNTS
ncbi:unnamed protein product [Moneuplotes crassus]|uniref:Uncharacterized protein n=1 Tax=Euplotes crassus TaxID=5936 RepID=A0AAD1UJM0_EUPCR|nr:unnamed protein product [Moneuplotes crassus]